jgi:hypothetical protein
VKHVRRPAALPRAAVDGSTAILACAEAFTFDPGNRLRASTCLVCGLMIGAQAATVIGVAGLAGDPCSCGGIVSDVFLVHAIHFPMPPSALDDAIQRGVKCTVEHPY